MYHAGSVMGMAVVGFGLVGVAVLLLVMEATSGEPQDAVSWQHPLRPGRHMSCTVPMQHMRLHCTEHKTSQRTSLKCSLA